MDTHTIACQDRTRAQVQSYELRYNAEEMKEVFTAAELVRLSQGRVVNRGLVRMVDATVIAQVALNASFGD